MHELSSSARLASEVTEVETAIFERVDALRASIESVIRGKQDAVLRTLVTLFAEGHLLVEDVPGVGKTMLAQALARSLDASFRRIQFTSDLLPSDILGVSVFQPASSSFEFKRGPIFANVVIADEINRSTPKAQSAMLEAMNEAQVSVDNTSHPLPRPFMVMATQNPIEHQGTYPLPESQLDRFLMKIRIGYPGEDDEKLLLADQQLEHPIDSVRPVMDGGEVIRIQQAARSVRLDAAIIDYMVRLVGATRKSEALALGVSPRGTLLLRRASQAHALVRGRGFVTPDDVKAVAGPVLGHRVIPRGDTATSGSSSGKSERIIEELLGRIAVPL